MTIYRVVKEYVDLAGPLCGTLEDILAQVEELIKTYGSNAELTIDTCGYDSVETTIEFERVETDKERAKRLKIAKQIRERKKLAKEKTTEQELKEYERLRNKYGDVG